MFSSNTRGERLIGSLLSSRNKSPSFQFRLAFSFTSSLEVGSQEFLATARQAWKSRFPLSLCCWGGNGTRIFFCCICWGWSGHCLKALCLPWLSFSQQLSQRGFALHIWYLPVGINKAKKGNSGKSLLCHSLVSKSLTVCLLSPFQKPLIFALYIISTSFSWTCQRNREK